MAKKKIELKKLGLRTRDIETDDFETFTIEFETPSATAINTLSAGVAVDFMGSDAANAENVVAKFLTKHLKSWTLDFELKRETFDALPDEVLTEIILQMRNAGSKAGN